LQLYGRSLRRIEELAAIVAPKPGDPSTSFGTRKAYQLDINS